MSNFRYSQYINAFHGRSGHRWQGRFHSCALDESYYGNALHYVEQNPVRAKMVRKAWRYPWSSAAVHCGAAKDDGLLDLAWWRERWDTRLVGRAFWNRCAIQHSRNRFGGTPTPVVHWVRTAF